MEVMFRSEHAENAEELLAYLDKMRDEIEPVSYTHLTLPTTDQV